MLREETPCMIQRSWRFECEGKESEAAGRAGAGGGEIRSETTGRVYAWGCRVRGEVEAERSPSVANNTLPFIFVFEII